MNVLLVEPAYRSKSPPLGLMRLSTYHHRRGDRVAFVRGENDWARARRWDRIYVASLFTWELPRAAETIEFYGASVPDPQDIFVGGTGVTLLLEYIRQRGSGCTIIEGPLDEPGRLGPGTPAIASLVPDYGLLERVDWEYSPRDAFFVRIIGFPMRFVPMDDARRHPKRPRTTRWISKAFPSVTRADLAERDQVVRGHRLFHRGTPRRTHRDGPPGAIVGGYVEIT